MEVFEATPKQWGNSLGVTIPRGIVRKAGLSPKRKVRFIVISNKGMKELRKAFGTLKTEKPTQRIMDEIDEGYD
ncbi:hypothetical protein COT48_03210 [Candidatus Woesearchaeota archaeon CG08_land_8_20_14_0_20_47_9]|nr:MAG: hypothetical protein AUJ69_01410 [Candidatus Woesearchaeota archaeon CG1_02_47_18]PIN74498.1 MAG: hypothetical protein COV22_01120 [Candidatus Woesearchaeota archaeon CG10_big_fil_rev_8_21_14_0_10_47_5]PIO03880.1 MAG: hypothetical protein COT48_03210 [Candidatus Woesearchaeota archaeon CG08_land_8_20_14_0_20_47_9]HII30341.1 AbrB/MazE/SpoVT family DNA-binding domain-containing protein [Candidatus Woesearchaeota archaeon]